MNMKKSVRFLVAAVLTLCLTQLAALAAFVLDVLYGIADGLPAVVRVLVHLKMRGDWQEHVLVIPASDKDEPLPELRNTVIHSIKNAIDSLVTQLVEL